MIACRSSSSTIPFAAASPGFLPSLSMTSSAPSITASSRSRAVEPVERRRTEEEENWRVWAVEGRAGPEEEEEEKGVVEKREPAEVEGPEKDEKGFERVREERREVGALLLDSVADADAAEEARAESESEAEGLAGGGGGGGDRAGEENSEGSEGRVSRNAAAFCASGWVDSAIVAEGGRGSSFPFSALSACSSASTCSTSAARLPTFSRLASSSSASRRSCSACLSCSE